MGKKRAVISLLEGWVACARMPEFRHVGDQVCASRIYQKRLPGVQIALDHESAIFQSAWGSALEGKPRFPEQDKAGWFDKASRPRNPETGMHPALVHFNGGKDMKNIYSQRIIGDASLRNQRFSFWDVQRDV